MSDIMPASPGDTNPTERLAALANELLTVLMRCTNVEYAASILLQFKTAARAATLAEAIEAARGEYLVDNTGTDEDAAYNQGVSDAIAAIDRVAKGARPSCGESDRPSGAGACVLAAGHGGPVHRDRHTNQWPANGGHDSLCGYASGITGRCTCKGADQ